MNYQKSLRMITARAVENVFKVASKYNKLKESEESKICIDKNIIVYSPFERITLSCKYDFPSEYWFNYIHTTKEDITNNVFYVDSIDIRDITEKLNINIPLINDATNRFFKILNEALIITGGELEELFGEFIDIDYRTTITI